jgi:hypothetical protein
MIFDYTMLVAATFADFKDIFTMLSEIINQLIRSNNIWSLASTCM